MAAAVFDDGFEVCGDRSWLEKVDADRISLILSSGYFGIIFQL